MKENNTDKTVKLAYRRMLGNAHGGATEATKPYASPKNTNAEIDYIIRDAQISEQCIIADFGCGNGRHSLALLQKHFKNIYSIDYLKENIDIANKNADSLNLPVCYQVGDCRDFKFNEKLDVAICLYDVIGSFSDNSENIKIIENIYNNLKSHGVAFISVMNSELTIDTVKKFLISNEPNAIFDLIPSSNMETTGEVFDVNHIIYDTDNGIYYRREQFQLGNELPIEILVCDKRYTATQLKKTCVNVGFNVEFIRYVRAGQFETSLPATDTHAKEILIKCIKP
jgi:SAM-dependent methyltransferase